MLLDSYYKTLDLCTRNRLQRIASEKKQPVNTVLEEIFTSCIDEVLKNPRACLNSCKRLEKGFVVPITTEQLKKLVESRKALPDRNRGVFILRLQRLILEFNIEGQLVIYEQYPTDIWHLIEYSIKEIGDSIRLKDFEEYSKSLNEPKFVYPHSINVYLYYCFNLIKVLPRSEIRKEIREYKALLLSQRNDSNHFSRAVSLYENLK
ncbi:MAG: hypothetical protein AAF316_00390, partial [Cyanobacteria bacterium P01_A01_bin.80]